MHLRNKDPVPQSNLTITTSKLVDYFNPPEENAAIVNARITAGPEATRPTSPESTYTPAPNVEPTPIPVKSKRPLKFMKSVE